MTAPRLELELVPKSAHKVNLRAVATKSRWQTICALTIARAGNHCEVCGAAATPRHSLETHEVWQWDERTQVQSLVRTIALCYWCHLAKHSGMAEKLGLLDRVHRHLMQVNAWVPEQLEIHVRQAWRVWLRRSAMTWSFEPDLDELVSELQAQAATTPVPTTRSRHPT